MQEDSNWDVVEEEHPRLLIVDDSELNRALLANIFESSYEIQEAENGKEGLALILSGRDSLSAVLLDVVMPEMNGLQVLHAMKSEGLLGQIPVFLITAESSEAVMQEAYELGVMDVISKPVIPYVVQRRVDSVVELFSARRMLGKKVHLQQHRLLQQAQQLAQMSFGMVEALSTTIEFRSDESGEHVRRIHHITEYLLQHTPLGEGLSKEEITLISMASIMHDVGKISIPDAILNKPGRLTPEEYEIMKTHTTKGAELLARIPQMRDNPTYPYAYDIALHHHERWDGRGYPEGLAGDQISIWAQIVSLADVYDALISKRCYKNALGYEEALAMICGGQCGTFNPRLLTCFLAVEPEIRKLYLPQESSRKDNKEEHV